MSKRGVKTITDPEIIANAIESGMYEALKQFEKDQNIHIVGAIVEGVTKNCGIQIKAYYEEKE